MTLVHDEPVHLAPDVVDRPRPARQPLRLKGMTAADHLNMVRGLAAVAVLWDHGRAQFFENFKDGNGYGPLALFVYTSSRFGHTAVMVFFVMSGLLIGSGAVDDVRAGRWSWRDYLSKRLTRLYIVLIPALALTLSLDRVWVAMSGGRLPAGAVAISPQYAAEGATPGVVLGNLCFLQNIYVRTLGANTALWSLSNEFWYYLIFPCLCLAVAGSGGPRRRLAWGLAGGAMLAFVGRAVALYFLIWLIGALLCLAPPIPWLRRHPGWARGASAVAFLPLPAVMALIALRKLPGDGWLTDTLLGLSFGAFLYVLLHRSDVSPGGRYARAAAALAGFSYTLYLVHMPILLVLRSCLTYETLWYPDAPHALRMLGVLSLVMALAFAFSRVTEAKTDVLRRRLMRRA